MSQNVTSAFAALSAPKGGVYVIFVGAALNPAPTVQKFLSSVASQLAAAAKTASFRGKTLSSMDILAPAGIDCDRLLVVGVEPDKEKKATDFVELGGFVLGKIGKSKAATIAFVAPDSDWDASAAADFMMGAHLRAYRFDKYKTKIKPEDQPGNLALRDPKLWADYDAKKPKGFDETLKERDALYTTRRQGRYGIRPRENRGPLRARPGLTTARSTVQGNSLFAARPNGKR